jgi:hypothetical protein
VKIPRKNVAFKHLVSGSKIFREKGQMYVNKEINKQGNVNLFVISVINQ